MIEIGKFSGEVDDTGYIGVYLLSGEHVYARPTIQVPFLSTPSASWISEYGKHYQAIVAYEMYEGSIAPRTPILLGALPLKNPKFPDTGYDKNSYIYTEKFRVIINDTDNSCVVEALDKGKIYLGAKDNSEPIPLGDKNSEVLSELAQCISDFINVVGAATTAPGDGGAAFKAAIISGSVAIQQKANAIVSTKATATKSKYNHTT